MQVNGKINVNGSITNSAGNLFISALDGSNGLTIGNNALTWNSGAFVLNTNNTFANTGVIFRILPTLTGTTSGDNTIMTIQPSVSSFTNSANLRAFLVDISNVTTGTVSAANFIGGNVGVGTLTPTGLFTLAGNKAAISWGANGINFQTVAATYSDTSTATSGTVSLTAINSFGIPTLTATNANVTNTIATNVYIAGAPTTSGTTVNTNSYALYVNSGATYLNGNFTAVATNSSDYFKFLFKGDGTNNARIQLSGNSINSNMALPRFVMSQTNLTSSNLFIGPIYYLQNFRQNSSGVTQPNNPGDEIGGIIFQAQNSNNSGQQTAGGLNMITTDGTNTFLNFAATPLSGGYNTNLNPTMALSSTGNLIISSTPNVDAGYKLDVNGTIRISGDSMFNGQIIITSSTVNNNFWSQGTGSNIFGNNNLTDTSGSTFDTKVSSRYSIIDPTIQTSTFNSIIDIANTTSTSQSVYSGFFGTIKNDNFASTGFLYGTSTIFRNNGTGTIANAIGSYHAVNNATASTITAGTAVFAELNNLNSTGIATISNGTAIFGGVNNNNANNTGVVYAGLFQYNHNGSGNSTTPTAISATTIIGSAASGSITTARGSLLQVTVNSGASTNITNTYPITAAIAHSGSGTMTLAANIRILAPTGTGIITTLYGIRLFGQARAGVTNAYGISQEGATDLNTFTGYVAIGSDNRNAAFSIQGNSSFSSWGVNGVAFSNLAATYTDISSATSSTIAVSAVNSFGIPTLTATNANVVNSIAATVYIAGAPTTSGTTTISSAQSLYIATGGSFFGGNIAIGNNNNGNSSNSINLNIGRDITGGTTAYALNIQSQIQSGVTTNASIFRTQISQVSATLNTLTHFSANQGTISGTINEQTGFFVSSGLITGTNNYGFRGSIPTGTNRWNLFMDGTANNYLAGKLLIGTTTDAGYTAFDFNGTGRVSGDLTTSARILIADGTGSLPSVAFSNNLTYGIYWNSGLGGMHLTAGNSSSGIVIRPSTLTTYSTISPGTDNNLDLASGASNQFRNAFLKTSLGIGGLRTIPNSLSTSPIFYNTGTIAQSGNTVTGTGTTFTAAMVGCYLTTNTSNGLITGFTNSTTITVSNSVTLTAGTSYTINYYGLQVDSTGLVSTSRLSINNDVSIVSWGINGVAFKAAAATYTDTSTAASGTVSLTAVNSFGIPTLTATNANVTNTIAANVYIAGAPTVSGTTVNTNSYALYVASGNTYLQNASIAAGSGGILTVRSSDAFGIDKGGSIALGGLFNSPGSSVNFYEISGRKENSADGNTRGYLQFYSIATGLTTLKIGSSGNLNSTTQTFSSNGNIHSINMLVSGISTISSGLVVRTETSIGSGAQKFIEGLISSTSKFYITNTGLGYFASKLLVGTTTDAGYTAADFNGTVRISSTVSATANSAISLLVSPTLVATANNDVLVGTHITPTFAPGSFTGVVQFGLRVTGTTGGVWTNSINNYDGGTLGLGGFGTNLVNISNTLVTSTGGFRITSNVASQQVLRLVGLTSQTGDYLAVNSVGNTSGNLFRVASTGNVQINSITDAGFLLDVNGTGRFQNTLTATKYQLSALNTAPSSSSDTGTTGEIRWVNGFVYLCVATNTWQRAALTTF